jgi:tetratricopeptide (TPR) repeat protein
VSDISLSDWQHAAQCFGQGRFADARVILEDMLERDPHSAEAWLALSQVDIHSSQVQQAASHALAAARLQPDNPKTLIDIAAVLLTVGEVLAARGCLGRAAALAPRDGALQQHLALQYQNLGDHTAALAWMQRARASGIADPGHRFALAVQFTFHGRMADAEAELERCVALQPSLGQAWAQLSQLRRQTPERNHLEALARQLAGVQPGSTDHVALEFARYKEFEDLHRHSEAWQSLQRANNVMHAQLRPDPAAERRTFEALASSVNALVRPPSRQIEGAAPVFIVGLPRSGTTLLDRLLGNHSRVESAGELGTFKRGLERVANRFTGPMLDEAFVECIPRMDLVEAGNLYLANSQWRAQGARFYVDKLPRNWLLVPLIKFAIPQARILHMTRKPIAVAFSNYRSYFGADYPYCYDEGTLVSHYRQYRQRLRDWHALLPGEILDVSYEALAADTETEMRKVLAFCGLDWEPACADLARNVGPVATLSAVQVRGRIQPGMADRWRNYAPQLASLRECLDAAMADDPST